MEGLRLWLKWCWKFKEILPWSISLVSDRELTKEEYEFPDTDAFRCMLASEDILSRDWIKNES